MTSLLLYEVIRTTLKRAKVVQPVVDRLIACAKAKEPRLAIRAINQVVTDKNACRKILEVLKPRYEGRNSGMTTITPLGARQGDGAKYVELSLIDAVRPGSAKEESAVAPTKVKKAKAATVAA